jgi:hypothetical protein
MLCRSAYFFSKLANKEVRDLGGRALGCLGHQICDQNVRIGKNSVRLGVRDSPTVIEQVNPVGQVCNVYVVLNPDDGQACAAVLAAAKERTKVKSNRRRISTPIRIDAATPAP